MHCITIKKGSEELAVHFTRDEEFHDIELQKVIDSEGRDITNLVDCFNQNTALENDVLDKLEEFKRQNR